MVLSIFQRNLKSKVNINNNNNNNSETSFSKDYNNNNKRRKGKFADGFEKGDLIDEGGFSLVYKATHKETRQVYAVKDCNTHAMERSALQALKGEISVLTMLSSSSSNRSCPHIIQLLDVYEEPRCGHTYLVMELMKGGDLLTRISEKDGYSEFEAQKTCRILLEAVDFLHKMKICHRDIKPDNVLLVEPGNDTTIKIADFGFAKKVTKPFGLHTLAGTPSYLAPEVLDDKLYGGYDYRADMWSVGVLVYILFVGYAPFGEGPVTFRTGSNHVSIQADYTFHEEYWGHVSEQAKTMIAQLLQVDVDKRWSAQEALECPWMTMTIVEEKETTKRLLDTSTTTTSPSSSSSLLLQQQQQQDRYDEEKQEETATTSSSFQWKNHHDQVVVVGDNINKKSMMTREPTTVMEVPNQYSTTTTNNNNNNNKPMTFTMTTKCDSEFSC